ncbi:MAG: hypothetical protein QW416_07420 [Candidatus Nitrosocaldaceae archaeon]
MKSLILLFSILSLLYYNTHVYAESNTLKMESKSLNVELRVPSPIETEEEIRIDVRFVEKNSNKTQVHVDYIIYIEDENNNEIFRTVLTHTNEGELTLPYVFFNRGSYIVGVEIYGINFIPIEKEYVEFSINVIPEFPLGVVGVFASIIIISIFIARKRFMYQI